MIKQCEFCGKEFQAVRKNHRFCSQKCQRKHWNLSHPEAYKASIDKYRNKTKDKIKHHNIEKILSNPAYYLWRTARYRAKKQHIPFEITPEDIIIPEKCPILNIPLKFKVGTDKGGANLNSPSVDKIIPELGYIKGNVRVISFRANVLKNNATIKELELVLKDLRRIKSNVSF